MMKKVPITEPQNELIYEVMSVSSSIHYLRTPAEVTGRLGKIPVFVDLDFGKTSRAKTGFQPLAFQV
jgi:hypothetical protein